MTRSLTAVAGLGAAVMLLGGCGGSDRPSGSDSSAAAAATVRTATCDSWNASSASDQVLLVRGMRAFFGGQVDTPGLHGTVLSDAKATQLFDSYCAQSFAGSFSLYRLYGNAAAFTNPKK